MTLAEAREQWEKDKANKGEDFDALTHEQQMAILEAAVVAERAKRK